MSVCTATQNDCKLESAGHVILLNYAGSYLLHAVSNDHIICTEERDGVYSLNYLFSVINLKTGAIWLYIYEYIFSLNPFITATEERVRGQYPIDISGCETACTVCFRWRWGGEKELNGQRYMTWWHSTHSDYTDKCDSECIFPPHILLFTSYLLAQCISTPTPSAQESSAGDPIFSCNKAVNNVYVQLHSSHCTVEDWGYRM